MQDRIWTFRVCACTYPRRDWSIGARFRLFYDMRVYSGVYFGPIGIGWDWEWGSRGDCASWRR